jgi:hypothetical protein
MPRFKKQCPSVEDLHDWYTCDYTTGILYWKNPRGPRVKVGDPVYTKPSNGYLSVELQLNYRSHKFLVHRLVWKMYYGEDLGQLELDHIDGNRANNSISNLRIATPTQNQHNRKRRGFKRSNHLKGQPCWKGGWEVRLGNNGVQKYLATYPCPLVARVAYESAKRFIAKEFTPFIN